MAVVPIAKDPRRLQTRMRQDMSMPLVITGPAAAGKSTVGQRLAATRERCALIDSDDVRHMVIGGHRAPWDGVEGARQHRLGILNVCALARQFDGEGFDVVIADVLGNELAQLYRAQLANLSVVIVQLLPSWECVVARSRGRHEYLSPDRIETIYHDQQQLSNYDVRIDSTTASVDELAAQLEAIRTWVAVTESRDS